MLLKQSYVKSIFKEKCWVSKEAWEKLDRITTEMIKDMANRISKIHEREERRKATAQDMQKAYEKHKESYEANLTEKIAKGIIRDLEDLITLMRTAHEPR